MESFAATRLCLAAAVLCVAPVAPAATIYATGQNNGDPTHASGLFYYAIDTVTGHATPLAAVTGANSAGLAGTPDGRLLGFRNNRLVQINPFTGVAADAGPVITGFNTTSLDVTHDNAIYATPVSGDTRLQRLDAATGTATPVGPANAIGNALDAFYGRPAGRSAPFVIGLGSLARKVNVGTTAVPNVVVADTLYGINLDDTNQLVAVNPQSGVASVVGGLNSVSNGTPTGKYSGFAALTGVDTDGDGLSDTLYGNVNFNDADPTLPNGRLGGLAKYDLATGTFGLIGTNPGLIFFGFGNAAVPEPARLAVVALVGLALVRRRTTASACRV